MRQKYITVISENRKLSKHIKMTFKLTIIKDVKNEFKDLFIS